MAIIEVIYDSKKSWTGELSAPDIQIAALIVDVFYIASWKREVGKVKLAEYDARIDEVRFRNPLNILATLKNVSKASADWVLQRTLFYKQECDRRDAQNEKSRQEVFEHKIKNAEKLIKLRKQILDGGLDSEEAASILGSLMSDNGMQLKLSGPDTRGKEEIV